MWHLSVQKRGSGLQLSGTILVFRLLQHPGLLYPVCRPAECSGQIHTEKILCCPPTVRSTADPSTGVLLQNALLRMLYSIFPQFLKVRHSHQHYPSSCSKRYHYRSLPELTGAAFANVATEVAEEVSERRIPFSPHCISPSGDIL